MTPQYEHAVNVKDALVGRGIDADVLGKESDRLVYVCAGGRSFLLPPFNAYSPAADLTAKEIAECI